MTRELPPGLAEVAKNLDQDAGSYLDGAVREEGRTCAVCSAPVAGHSLCFPCKQRVDFGLPLADRVASLVYAVEPDSQTYLLVREYKGQRPVRHHQQIMSALLALGLRGHTVCAADLAGVPIGGWAVVPSTRGRPILRDLVVELSRSPSQEIPIRYDGPPGKRDFTPGDWPIGVDAVPKHVLVIDDSWVTGAHAQSVASSLKAAGAQQVSILTVARVLDPGWAPSEAFIRERLGGGTFDWQRCPWTGGHCPSDE